MARTYKCTNVKFCMDDEVQRQAWEYLHSLGKENGSFGKIISESLMGNANQQQGNVNVVELSEQSIEKISHKLLQELKKNVSVVTGIQHAAEQAEADEEGEDDMSGAMLDFCMED